MTNDQIATYVEQISELIDLPIDSEYFPGVVENFATISAIASVLMDFPLPETVEPAPVFEP